MDGRVECQGLASTPDHAKPWYGDLQAEERTGIAPVYVAHAAGLTMLTMRRYRLNISTRSIVAVLGCACVMGCASQVEVEAQFPTPLVEQLPVTIGIVLDEALTEYEHFEEIPEQITWTIRLGEANRAMLQQLLGTMFRTVAVDTIPTADTGSGLDGVLKPELEKFEFEVPVRGRDNFAEVWMQYRLKLFEPDGDLVTDWPVSGYGKAELGNKERALNQATIVAMREVGAAISTRFAELPQVEYWLQERRNDTALSADNPVRN